jgi:hypothetical protein
MTSVRTIGGIGESQSLDSIGPAQTAAMKNYIVERLCTPFPDVPGRWRPA